MLSTTQFQKPTFLEKIDIFGIPIAIRFNTLPSHNTRFGGFITVSIIGLIVFQLISVMNTLFSQTTPQVIYSDDYVSQPEPFKIQPDTFNFAISLQDGNSSPYIDETIYKVKGISQNLMRVYNETTGVFDQKWILKDIQLVKCDKNSFQIEQSKEYFSKIPYQKLYCFKKDEQNAIIEGEFSSPVYKAIVLEFVECIGDGCATKEVKDKYLNNLKLGMFISNNIIQITNKEDPKLTVGKNLFWASGPSLQKAITINLVNNYINSDFSLYGKSQQKQRVVSFSSAIEQVLPRTSSSLFKFAIAYEKNREINYYRRYLKLDEAFSQLGGMFNGLLALGFLICKPLSQLELNRKLLNSVFNISKEDQEELEKANVENYIKNKNVNDQQDSIDEKSQNVVGGQQDSQQLKSSLHSKSEINIKKSQDITKSIKKEEIRADVTNFFKVQFQELQIKFWDYITNYLSFMKRFRTAKQKLITYGTNKLYSQIDVFYILSKLIELEKLKHLLLNDNQIKLFEYLPRPQLKLQEVFNEEIEKEQAITKNKNGNQIQEDNKSSILNSPSPIKNKNLKSSSIKKQKEKSQKFILFNHEEKNPLEKAQDAQKAFNQISKKTGQKSYIDEKLIRMLDPKLVNMFKDNSFDFGQSEDESQEFGNLIIEKSQTLMKKSLFQNNDATFKLNKTIIELEDDNRDIFNVSSIQPMNSQNNVRQNQQGQESYYDKNSHIPLIQSESLDKKIISHLNQNTKEVNPFSGNMVVSSKLGSNNVENSLYQEQNNQFHISPLTTNRQLQENSEIFQRDKNNQTDGELKMNLNYNIEELDEAKYNDGGSTPQRDIKIQMPSTTRRYFEEINKQIMQND